MSHYEIDHKLLDKFLGHVLDRSPAKYMQSVLAGEFDRPPT